MDLEPTHPKRVGQRIRQMRLMLGQKNASAFARSVGLTPQALNNYEKGIGWPEVSAGTRLAVRGGVTMDWIYRGETAGLSQVALRAILEIEAQEREADARTASG